MDLRQIGVEVSHVAGITALGVLGAISYGIAHDQVTARICVEYFTIGHPNLLGVDPHRASPTVQALLWGVIATWWVGLLLGAPAALLSRLGRWPRLSARDLLRPLGILLATMAVISACSGILGYTLAAEGVIWLTPRLADQLPPDRHARFLADGWAHGAAYLVGALGGLTLWGWILVTRRARSRRASQQG